MAAWLKNESGEYLSPAKQKSERARARRKKHKTNKDKYTSRTLTRKCPKDGAVITKKRRLKADKELGIPKDVTVYICPECGAVWGSKQVIKVWQNLKRSSPKMSRKEFKALLNSVQI